MKCDYCAGIVLNTKQRIAKNGDDIRFSMRDRGNNLYAWCSIECAVHWLLKQVDL